MHKNQKRTNLSPSLTKEVRAKAERTIVREYLALTPFVKDGPNMAFLDRAGNSSRASRLNTFQ